MVAMVQSSHRLRFAARWAVGVFAALFAASGAHAGAPDPGVDVVAVLVGDGLGGYGRSLGASLDALMAEGVVDAATGARSPDGVARADLLRFLAAGSTTAVVVQGAGYAPALAEVATALPEEAFIWIPGDAPTAPATMPAGPPDVSTIYADVAAPATLLGELLADGRLAEVQRLGWTGSSEPSGDDGVFITALLGAAGLNAGSVVLTSRLDETPANSEPDEDMFDVLLVSGRAPSELQAPLRIEIAGSLADDSDAPSGPDSARRIVVVFHYEVALAEILAGYEAGELGGTEHHLTLENGGLTIEASDSGDAEVLRDALVDAGLLEPVDSSPTTSEDATEQDGTAPADSEAEPSPTTRPVASTPPGPGTTITVPGTRPPDTDAPGPPEPTQPSTPPPADGPGPTDPPPPTNPPPTVPLPTVPLPTVPLPTAPLPT